VILVVSGIIFTVLELALLYILIIYHYSILLGIVQLVCLTYELQQV